MEPEKLKQHLDSWVEMLPKGFHKNISLHLSLPADQIYEIFVKENKFNP